MMRRRALFLLTLLCLAPAASAGMSPATTAGRGGINDDFLIADVNVGANATIWIQPNGTQQPYLEMGETVDLTIQYSRAGTSLVPKNATLSIVVRHPIGFVISETQVVVPSAAPNDGLSGGSSGQFEWQFVPTVAHSILDPETGILSGGMDLEISINNPSDDRNENDARTVTLPVAIARDDMDGQEDGGVDTFIPIRYDKNSPFTATGRGLWQEDATGGAVGSSHWRPSNPGGTYASNARDRLVFGYSNGGSQCDLDADTDGEASQVYVAYICRKRIISAEYQSIQFNVQTWGDVNPGDTFALEMWRSGGASIVHNFTDDAPSNSPGAWSNVSWDATPQLGGQTWNVGILLDSDVSGATEGFHVDDWVMFGVQKVDEFTLGLECDDPAAGYSAAPNSIVTLHCMVTNNGYRPATFRVRTNVTNTTWMNPVNPAVRIEAEGTNQNGVSVLMSFVPANATRSVWVNLSVPPGAEIQQQVWNVWWEDASSTGMGELGRRTTPIAITEQYGVMMSSNTALQALDLEPGETGTIPFRLQNTGNLFAGYRLSTSFSGVEGSDWSAQVFDESGSMVTSTTDIPLARGQNVDYTLNVTAPERASPGVTTFSLRAMCPTCTSAVIGNDVLVRQVETPIFRDVDVQSETREVTRPANGQMVTIPMTVMNLGNADEEYTLSLQQSDPRLRASLTSETTGSMDAWEGERIISLQLPMPLGLPPADYSVTVRATSADDPSVTASHQVIITITETPKATVADVEVEDSFIPGGPEQNVRFMVTNDGNIADRFDIALEYNQAEMTARTTGLTGGQTIMLEPGASTNVSVIFGFASEVDGTVRLVMRATSTVDPTVSGTGSSEFIVGSQGFLRLIAPPQVILDESTLSSGDATVDVQVRLRNQFTELQSVTLEIARDDSTNFYVDLPPAERNFVVQSNNEYLIVLTIRADEAFLESLSNENVTENFTLYARSNSIEETARAYIEVRIDGIPEVVEGPSEEVQSAARIGAFALQVVLPSIVILVLIGVLVSVLRRGWEDDLEDDVDDEYQDSLTAAYGAVASAPDMATFGKSIPTLPSGEERETPQPIASISTDDERGPPPKPPSGLPAGWTEDQWEHYGWSWLDQNA